MGTTEHHKKPDDKLRRGGRGEGGGVGGGSLRLIGNQLINTPSYLLFQKPIENIF